MKSKIVIQDPRGFGIKSLIVIILWYSHFISHRIINIPNFLLFVGVLLILLIITDRNAISFFMHITTAMKWQAGFFLLILPVGMIAAPSFSSHVGQWVTCIEYLLISISILYYCVTRNNYEFILRTLFILFIIMCIIYLLSPIRYSGVEGRAQYSFSTRYNPNSFAINLTLCIWITLFYVMKGKLRFIFAAPIIGMLLYGIILTGSRKGIIGALLCIMVWTTICYFSLNKKKSIFLTLSRILTALGLVYIGWQLIYPFYATSRLAYRMSFLLFEATEGTRAGMYRVAFDLFKESPLVGHGLQGFQYYYGGLYSHSTISEVFVSGGIVLGAIYFFSYFSMGINLYINDKRANNVNDYEQRVKCRMGMVLLILMVFYSVAIVHIYSLASFVNFAIIMALYSKNATEQRINYKYSGGVNE